jgi:excisionase family DNA binding protein
MSITSTGLSDFERALVVKPRGAQRMLNCGRKKVYQLIAEGKLASFKDGASRKITVASIHEYINRCLAESASSMPKRPT